MGVVQAAIICAGHATCYAATVHVDTLVIQDLASPAYGSSGVNSCQQVRGECYPLLQTRQLLSPPPLLLPPHKHGRERKYRDGKAHPGEEDAKVKANAGMGIKKDGA